MSFLTNHRECKCKTKANLNYLRRSNENCSFVPFGRSIAGLQLIPRDSVDKGVSAVLDDQTRS